MCNLLLLLYMQILIIIRIFRLNKFSSVKYYSNIFINHCVRIIILLNSWLPTTDKFVFLDFHRVMYNVTE